MIDILLIQMSLEKNLLIDLEGEDFLYHCRNHQDCAFDHITGKS